MGDGVNNCDGVLCSLVMIQSTNLCVKICFIVCVCVCSTILRYTNSTA